jgi:hypothetical protein
MKNIFFLIALFGGLTLGHSQFLNWGVKGGVNYNSNGDLRATDFSNLAEIGSGEETGYHFGLLAEIKLPLFLYIRPELIYTHTESSYESEGDRTRLKMDKIEAPILVGFRVLRIGRFFFGPSFQYIINTDLSPTENLDRIRKLDSDDFTVSGQIGLGLNLGRFGADIRWETGFTESEADFIGNAFDGGTPVALNVDTSHQQFILSFYWKFGKGK